MIAQHQLSRMCHTQVDVAERPATDLAADSVLVPHTEILPSPYVSRYSRDAEEADGEVGRRSVPLSSWCCVTSR